MNQANVSTVKRSKIYETVKRGSKRGARLHPHAGQQKALQSRKRFVVVLAGTQGGKTALGPWWLYHEIKAKGSGDYMVVTPTYKLLNLKALPEFKKIFVNLLGLGEYKITDKVFTFDALGERRTWGAEQDDETRVIFGFATDPDSLESATAKAAWLDEAGQSKFKLSSYEAILRRLSLNRGRVLITTTPYNLGWVKQQLYDKRQSDPDIDVIRFDSTENPSFPPEEMERARRDLPLWKFNMFYRAIFTRPAGMIYDCFDEMVHVVRRFAIPANWPRFLGLDFGGVNTAGVYVAAEPGFQKFYAYREYHAGGRTAKQHTEALEAGEMTRPITYGGSWSEGQWRNEFAAAGWPVNKPLVSDVEVGINRVYGAFNNLELFVFDDLSGLLDEIGSYSRKLDANDEPTEAIADKETFHLLDALRYVFTYLGQSYQSSVPEAQPGGGGRFKVPGQKRRGGSRWRIG